MANTVKLKIEKREELLGLYWELGKAGLLKDVSVEQISLPESCFPIEIPVELDGLIGLLTSPMVKPFKKRIDTTLQRNLAKVIG